MPEISAAIAKAEIFELLTAAWQPTGLTLIYPNMPGNPPQTASAWARVTIRPLAGRQVSLTNQHHQQRWESRGQVDVQIMSPGGSGSAQPAALVQVVLGAFRGKTTPGGLRFTNVYEAAGGPDGLYWMSRVVAEYVFEEYVSP
jgi:hypothetical protein